MALPDLIGDARRELQPHRLDVCATPHAECASQRDPGLRFGPGREKLVGQDGGLEAVDGEDADGLAQAAPADDVEGLEGEIPVQLAGLEVVSRVERAR